MRILINWRAVRNVSQRLGTPGRFAAGDDADAAVVSCQCQTDIAVRSLERAREVVQPALGVDVGLVGVFSWLEVKRHDLKKPKGAGAGAGEGVAAGFDLHDNGDQIGVEG